MSCFGAQRLAGLAFTAALMAATSTIAVTVSQAQEAAQQKFKFDIAPKPVPQGVNEIGRITGLSVVISENAPITKTGKPVIGTMSAATALSILLNGTGLSYRFSNASTVTIVASSAAAADAGNSDGATALAPITVAASRSGTSDPNANMTNPPTTIGSKEAVTQRQIPQSVTVVDQKQIQNQNYQNVDDVMRSTPGVTVNLINPNTTAYYARGFPIATFQLDGTPTAIPSGGAGTIADTLSMYDRVEVLRGPAGLLNGFGGDGGVVNLVRKHAPTEFEARVDTTGGSYDTLGSQVDVGGPLNAEGTLRGRLVGLEQYQHLMQDTTWQRDRQIYGTLEADLSDTTTARIGGSYSRTNGKVMYGLPGYSDYQLLDVARSEYLGADWNYLDNKRANQFAEVEEDLGGDWKAKLSYNHLQIDTQFLNGIPGGPVDPVTGDGNPYSYNYRSHDVQNAIDLFATGPYELFGREHQLTVGGNYLTENTHNTQSFVNPATGLDDWGDYYSSVFDANDLYVDDFNGGRENDNRTTTNQFGLYANTRFKLLDPLTLVAGARLTWWNSKLTPNADPYDNYFGQVATDTKIGPKFSPIIGLIYDINDSYSVYGSYTSIFKPQSNFYSVSGNLIAPVEGEQYEVGVKGEYLDGRVTTSFAVFQIDEANRAFSDPSHPGYYLAQGNARSRGFEITASGEVLPDLTVTAGYTYQNVVALDDSTNAGAPFSMTAPRHLFKLSANYQLPGKLEKVRVGGGAYVTSSTSYGDGIGNYVAGGYATFDAHVGYKINDHVSANLNVNNIFDRKYYQSVAGAAGNYYGMPRTVMLSVHTTF